MRASHYSRAVLERKCLHRCLCPWELFKEFFKLSELPSTLLNVPSFAFFYPYFDHVLLFKLFTQCTLKIFFKDPTFSTFSDWIAFLKVQCLTLQSQVGTNSLFICCNLTRSFLFQETPNRRDSLYNQLVSQASRLGSCVDDID